MARYDDLLRVDDNRLLPPEPLERFSHGVNRCRGYVAWVARIGRQIGAAPAGAAGPRCSPAAEPWGPRRASMPTFAEAAPARPPTGSRATPAATCKVCSSRPWKPLRRKGHAGRGRKVILSGDGEVQSPDATTLDRVHAAMLLQASGQANALRKLLNTEQDRGPDFLRLANALSALYSKGCEEKRLLDAMLLAVPR